MRPQLEEDENRKPAGRPRPKYPPPLAQQIRQVRHEAGLTQKEVGKKMGTSESYVQRLEMGYLRPSVRALERVAAACGKQLKIEFE